MSVELSTLSERLGSQDPGVRRVALLDFADDGEEELLPAVIELLRDDPDPTLRAEAARALAGWDDRAVVVGLADALGDVPAVREVAATSLTELKDPSAAALLIPYAGHADAFVAAAALRGVKELRLPAAAQAALVGLHNADSRVRREAVGVLGWLKLAAALEPIAGLATTDPDEEVRRASCGALGMAAPVSEAAQAALVKALRDAAWQVREEAATTLGKFQLQEHDRAALRGSLEDDRWQVRLRAARSLGRLRDITAVSLLIEGLVHTAGNLRKECAIALSEVGDARAVPALRAAAADPDPEVRKAIRLALQRLDPSA